MCYVAKQMVWHAGSNSRCYPQVNPKMHECTMHRNLEYKGLCESSHKVGQQWCSLLS